MPRIPIVALSLLVLLALPLAADDLTVGWISRSPEIDYVWGSTNPTVEGWPAAGQDITWRAHVRTWSDAPQTVRYRWTLDGAPTLGGAVTLAPNAVTTVDLPSKWSFERHRIGFSIDTANVMAEESEVNNTLTVFSDALAVGFWVEQSFYDYFRENQHKLGTGSTSFEDWAQQTMTYFNEMAALAVYPETPEGVLDRLRLQKIVVVPDQALPLSGFPDGTSLGATGGTHPDHLDHSVDLMWGFRTGTLSRYRDDFRPVPQNDFYVGYAALHEMGHARYLVDIYAWDVTHRQSSEFQIEIRENGASIVGPYLPSTHRTPEQGLMNAQYTFLDRYGAITWNHIAGARAVMGNYNEPRNFAKFLNDFPAQNRLTVRDGDGNLMRNADIWFYYSMANGAVWYSTHYDNVPDLKLRTDENGQVLVGRAPFAADGQVVHTVGLTNGVAIVRVATAETVAYGYLESRLFNIAYWGGRTDFADHDLVVGRACNSEGPELTGPAWDARPGGPALNLTWRSVPGATAYRVYAAANLGKPRLIGTTTDTSLAVNLSGSIHWWVEADLGVCGTRRSDMRRFFVEAPRRRAVR
ncbi:MAG TPA: hypothetical protein VEK57_19440 [Thermoanaerobaculia bacterium]|nr:hypothetical protein [Thermoanaerobaculia bacterium]